MGLPEFMLQIYFVVRNQAALFDTLGLRTEADSNHYHRLPPRQPVTAQDFKVKVRKTECLDPLSQSCIVDKYTEV